MHAYVWKRFFSFQTSEDNPPILSANEFAKYFHGSYILYIFNLSLHDYINDSFLQLKKGETSCS